MKRIIPFTIILIAQTACTAPLVQMPEPAATEIGQVNMPNPASVYCVQNGNKLEIRMAGDGSQNGICAFPDDSTCDERTYYRLECGPSALKGPTPPSTIEAAKAVSGGDPGVSPGTGGDNPGSYMPLGVTEEISDWWGVIKSTGPGA
jgi:putative hemolysin